MLAPTKFEPSTKEADVTGFQTVILKPFCVGTCGQEANDLVCSAALYFTPCFFNPLSDGAPIGRVHKTYTMPRHKKPIILWGEVLPAFSILGKCAYVDVKVKLSVQCIEEVLWGCLKVCLA